MIVIIVISYLVSTMAILQKRKRRLRVGKYLPISD